LGVLDNPGYRPEIVSQPPWLSISRPKRTFLVTGDIGAHQCFPISLNRPLPPLALILIRHPLVAPSLLYCLTHPVLQSEFPGKKDKRGYLDIPKPIKCFRRYHSPTHGTRTARPVRLVRIWISVLRNACHCTGLSFAYLLTSVLNRSRLRCPGGQVGRVDSVGIVLRLL
jgi:hypothetical protein